MNTEESILVTRMRERDLPTIIDWFDEQKNSFYKIGWALLQDPMHIKDVFHQTIMKVFDEIHHFKYIQRFDTWVTSIFLQICREVSKQNIQGSEGKETNPLESLVQLENKYNEVIALSYFKDFTIEEVASILDEPINTVKSRLFTALQQLTESGNTRSTNCSDYQTRFIDYLNRTLDRPEKIGFEIHLHTCQDCQNELSALQDMILFLSSENILDSPPDFMQQVKNKINQTIHERELLKKKRTKRGIVVGGILSFLLFIGFITNSFATIYYSFVDWIQDEDKLLSAYLINGVGERLNMEVEDNGIKVKIKTAITDEVQTLIYYEIEDMNEDNQYMINFFDGAMIENEFEILNNEVQPMYTPPLYQEELNKNNKKKNVYKGTFSILPIKSDSGTIKLKLSRVQKVRKDDTNPFGPDVETVSGDWSFEIPVTKQKSIVHNLDVQKEFDGVPIHFDKAILAPTATILQYSFNNGRQDKQISSIHFTKLESKKKDAKVDIFGGYQYVNSTESNRWDNTMQYIFETLYFENPKDITVHLEAINFNINDYQAYDLDVTKEFPQVIEYLGNKLSIEEVQIGDPTKVVITDTYTENRPYEMLNIQVTTKQEGHISMGNGGDGVLIDKNGKKYDPFTYNYYLDAANQPRYFQTKHEIEVFNEQDDEPVMPEKIEIHGYSTTSYIDDTVKIPLH